jgi:hypothetical protein
MNVSMLDFFPDNNKFVLMTFIMTKIELSCDRYGTDRRLADAP